MPLNFPANPSFGDTYITDRAIWQFNGIAWDITSFSNPADITQVSIDALSDVDTTTLPPTDGQSLIWNNANSVWAPATVSGGGGGDTNQNAFSNISVTGQGIIAADNVTDTLTITAGTGISLTADFDNDSIVITNTASSGSLNFSGLNDATTANVDISQIYESAIVTLRVDNVGTVSYTFPSHYTGSNPNIYALSGTTIAFDLTEIPGHPFEIQSPTGDPFNTGLVHVAADGTVSTGENAQGKDSGTLYWRIPENVSGNYRYQCQSHASMVGAITIKRFSLI